MESVKTVILGKPVFLLTGAKPRKTTGSVSASSLEVEVARKIA